MHFNVMSCYICVYNALYADMCIHIYMYDLGLSNMKSNASSNFCQLFEAIPCLNGSCLNPFICHLCKCVSNFPRNGIFRKLIFLCFGATSFNCELTAERIPGIFPEDKLLDLVCQQAAHTAFYTAECIVYTGKNFKSANPLSPSGILAATVSWG